MRAILAALFLCAVSSCAFSPAFAFFQGPWNVYEQRTLQGYARSSGGEGSLSPTLRGVIATIRSRYGRGAVSGVGGARRGNVAGTRMPSCHNGGHAFDAHLSSAARSYVMSRRDLGVIIYSGRMHHVHVSDCVRERGGRWHKRS